LKQNSVETHSKQPKFHWKIQNSQEKKREPEVSRLLPNVFDFQTENHT
jgi:hypothetical protein